MTMCLPHVHLEALSPELRVTSEVTHSWGTPKVKGEEDRASICSQARPSPSPWLLEHPTLAAPPRAPSALTCASLFIGQLCELQGSGSGFFNQRDLPGLTARPGSPPACQSRSQNIKGLFKTAFQKQLKAHLSTVSCPSVNLLSRGVLFLLSSSAGFSETAPGPPPPSSAVVADESPFLYHEILVCMRDTRFP